MGIDTKTYIALSVVMFLEYAIWGAWAPVLAARLLGPLKMSGKQTGWIYATLPIACIFAPMAAGSVADQWLNAEWIFIGAHLAGAVLLFVAARQEKFGPLFGVMLCYSLCYGATLPLVNAVLFTGTSNIGDDAIKLATQGKVFIWAPVAWALVGWALTGWRMTRKTQGDGSDCLYFASGLSILMVLGGLFVTVVCPAAPAGEAGGIPIRDIVELLGEDVNLVIFLLISLVFFGLMQFYFLGSAQFMQDKGIASKHVPGSMALAQAAQALATYFLMILLVEKAGYRWTLTLGTACWFSLYLVYIAGKPRWLLIAIQPLHGLAYVFFVIVGQIFVNTVAPVEIRSSMQALIFAATTGVGLFLGTQLAGAVMDFYSEDGKFQWHKIWLVPCAITLAGVIALILAFHDPPEDAPAKDDARLPQAVSVWQDRA